MKRLLLISMLLLGLLFLQIDAQESSESRLRFWVDTLQTPFLEMPYRYLLLDEEANVIDRFARSEIMGELSNGSLAISPNGHLFAQIGVEYSSQQARLWVYDTSIDTMIYQGLLLKDDNVSLVYIDDEHIAVGSRALAGNWEIQIVDLIERTVSHSLTDNDFEGLGVDISNDDPSSYMRSPALHAADSNGVLFSLTRPNQVVETFFWSYRNNTIKNLGNYFLMEHRDLWYGTGIGTQLPYSSLAFFPKVDDRLLFFMQAEKRYAQYPYQTEYGNSVHVFDMAREDYFPIYNSIEGVIQEIYLVQNGERLLLSVAADYSEIPNWYLIEYDGSFVATIFTGRIETIFGTEDGFILDSASGISFADSPSLTARNTIYTYNTRDFSYRTYASELLRQPDYIGPDRSPKIVWASMGSTALPELAPIMPALPSEQSLSQDLSLRINGAAYVSSLNGEAVNLRETPSLSAPILDRLQNNQRVILLDGPVEADGFLWWQVWVRQGLLGWLVQAVGDEILLRPPDISRAEPLDLVEANLVSGASGINPIAVGMSVRVVSDGANIREATGLNAPVLEVLLLNARLSIIDGPFADDGLRWWRVRSDSGTEGWIAEVSEGGEIIIAPEE